MIGFTTHLYYYQIGSGDLLHSFFSTVAHHLEGGKWGSRYPLLMNELYQGELAAEHTAAALEELADIKDKLKSLSPDKVIWDIDDLVKRPPWGDNISADITDMSNYYVTSDGEDFMTIFFNALKKADELGKSLQITMM